MTSPDELAWNHSIDTENYDFADEIAKRHPQPDIPNGSEEPPVSNAVKEQRAILGAAAYWGLDYGSLPNNEP